MKSLITLCLACLVSCFQLVAQDLVWDDVHNLQTGDNGYLLKVSGSDPGNGARSLNWGHTSQTFKVTSRLGSLSTGDKWVGFSLADADLTAAGGSSALLRYGFWVNRGRVYVIHQQDLVGELRGASSTDNFEVSIDADQVSYIWNGQLFLDFTLTTSEMLQVFADIEITSESITDITVDFGGNVFTFDLDKDEDIATHAPFIAFQNLGQFNFQSASKRVMIPSGQLNATSFGNSVTESSSRRLQLKGNADLGTLTDMTIVDLPAYSFKGNPAYSSLTLVTDEGIKFHQPLHSVVELGESFDNCSEDQNTALHYVQEVLYDQNGVAWSASKTYKNGLGNREQSLVKSYSNDFYIAQQGVPDRLGIQTLNTLPAPTYDENGCYQAQFIQRVSGLPYTHDQFDKPANESDYRDKAEQVRNTTKGSVGWYYSNNNNEETHVAASGYPFAVSDYYFEPTLRLKQAGLQGDDHQFNGHTNKVYHLGHAGELEYIYGRGNHYIKGERGAIYAKKTLTVDVNGLERVTYTDETGRPIASCYSGLGECIDQKITKTFEGHNPIPLKVHLHYSKRNTLKLTQQALPWSYVGQKMVDYWIMDVATNYTLVENQDYTINSTTYEVDFSGYEAAKGWATNSSKVFLIGLTYNDSYTGQLTNWFHQGVWLNWYNNSAMQFISYELDYSHWEFNYYDTKGNLVETVLPEGVDCDSYDPNIEYNSDTWLTIEHIKDNSTNTYKSNTDFQNAFAAGSVNAPYLDRSVTYIINPIIGSINHIQNVTYNNNDIPLCEFLDLTTPPVRELPLIEPGIANSANITLDFASGALPTDHTTASYRTKRTTGGSSLGVVEPQLAAKARLFQTAGIDQTFRNAYYDGPIEDPVPPAVDIPGSFCDACDDPVNPEHTGGCFLSDFGDAYLGNVGYSEMEARSKAFTNCRGQGKELNKIERKQYGTSNTFVWCYECGDRIPCLDEVGRFIARFKIEVKVHAVNTAAAPASQIEHTDTKYVYASLRQKTCHTVNNDCGLYWADLTDATGTWNGANGGYQLPNNSNDAYEVQFEFGDFYIKTGQLNQFELVNNQRIKELFMAGMGVKASLVYEEYNNDPNYPQQAPVNMKNVITYDDEQRVEAINLVDQGLSHVNYDSRDRLVFSRDAEQAKTTVNKFNYVLYDALNRPVEYGVFNANDGTNSGPEVVFQNLSEDPASLGAGQISTLLITDNADAFLSTATTAREDKVNLVYDVAPTLPVGYPTTYTPQNTFNRLAYTENANEKTWYSYDYYGRLEWQVIQQGTAFKTLQYFMDALGNVSMVAYQAGTAEAFYHHYTYDADKRLTTLQTSLDGSNKTLQATYQYYQHGPLKRVELGDGLQGVDYAYTIHGWLKSINSAQLDKGVDPGGDALRTDLATSLFTVPDVFGETYDYYAGDYERAGTYIGTYQNEVGDQLSITDRYDGLLKASRWQHNEATTAISANLYHEGEQLFYGYAYDTFNRIKSATFSTVSADGNQNNLTGGTESPEITTPNDDYKLWNINYDDNGNIQSLNRNAYGANRAMDAFTYHYEANTNTLNDLVDTRGATLWADDLEPPTTQGGTLGYSYLANGKLAADVEQGEYYTYNGLGRIDAVYTDAAHTTIKARYYYNGAGQRIKKEVYHSNGNLQQEVTYVVAQSKQAMVVYTKEYDNGGAQLASTTQYPVYGADRIGMYDAESTEYFYELHDRKGSVRAVVKDGSTNSFYTSFEGSGAQDHLYSGGTIITQSSHGSQGVSMDGRGPHLNLLTQQNDQLVMNLDAKQLVGGSAQLQLNVTELDDNNQVLFSQSYPVVMPGSAWGSYTTNYTVQQAGAAKLKLELESVGGEIHVDVWQFIVTPSGSGQRVKNVTTLAITDFYPFGSVMPGRNYSNDGYRYQYAGKESDAERHVVNYELRQYDGRLARWHNPDPLMQYFSPYVAMGNDPVNRIDPSGGTDYYVDGMKVPSAYGSRMFNEGTNILHIDAAGEELEGMTLGHKIDGENHFGMEGIKMGTEVMMSEALAALNEKWNADGVFFSLDGNDIKMTYAGEIDPNAPISLGFATSYATVVNIDIIISMDDITGSPNQLEESYMREAHAAFIFEGDDESWGFWGEGSVPYDGEAIGGTNFIGPGPDGPNANPYSLPDKKNPRKILRPIDAIDAAAQRHDYAYWLAETGGVGGALFNSDVAVADLYLTLNAYQIVQGYYNGDTDPITRKPISVRTRNLAAGVFITFSPISMSKLPLR